MQQRKERAMRKPVLAASAISLSVTLIAVAAWAAQPVFDAESVAKASETINELKKHGEVMAEGNRLMQGNIDAVGAKTRLVIPGLDIPKIRRQLNADMQCLMPDFEGLMPGVEFDNIEFGSICNGRSTYEQTLTFDPESPGAAQMTTSQREVVRNQVRDRRETVFNDAVLKSMAQGDTAIAAANEINEAATRLAGEAETASDLNSRMAVNNQALVILIRAQAQTNMLLAQLLKLQASHEAQFGMDVDVKPVREGR